jgi:hypothetical protein
MSILVFLGDNLVATTKVGYCDLRALPLRNNKKQEVDGKDSFWTIVVAMKVVQAEQCKEKNWERPLHEENKSTFLQVSRLSSNAAAAQISHGKLDIVSNCRAPQSPRFESQLNALNGSRERRPLLREGQGKEEER